MKVSTFLQVQELISLVEEVHRDLPKIRVKEAMQVTEASLFFMKAEKMINEYSTSIHTEIVLAAALLHNCGASRASIERDVCKLFSHRAKINAANKKLLTEGTPCIDSQYIDSIFMAIESQFGKSSPVQSLIPNSGHIGHIVSLACELVYAGRWNSHVEDN